MTGKYIDKLEAELHSGQLTLKPEAVTPERIAKFRQLEEIAKRRGQSLAQMALAWVLREGGATSVLIGASRVSQIEENVQAVHQAPLTEEELREIDEAMQDIGNHPW
ncbi:L-glyceraldehyde 3-phosphate reductase [compost metagenome]